MDKELPARPSLEQLRKQAKDLLKSRRAALPEALSRIARSLPALRGKAEAEIARSPFALRDAQSVVAREHGFESWEKLREEVERRGAEALAGAVDRFRKIVRKGGAAELRALLEEEPRLGKKLDDPLFDFDSPAIRVAVDRKDRPLIDALLAAGADINHRSQWHAGGFGVLDNVDDELGDYLIARGAVVDIHAAAGLGRLDRLEQLLKDDPKLANARGGDGGTPLHFARNAAAVDLLLRYGADPALRDRDHHSTAAMWQIRNRDSLYRLIAAGAPADIFMACVHGDEGLARRILRDDPRCLGAVVESGRFSPDVRGNIYNWRIGFGARPLPVAARFGHEALIAFLLGHAAPQERLVFACVRGDGTEARAILDREPGLLDTLDKNDLRALPNAAFYGNEAGVRVFLDIGFPLTGVEMDGVGTALHVAAWKGDAAIVELLLQHGASPNLKDAKYGSNAFGWCTHGSNFNPDRPRSDYGRVARTLIAAGAGIPHPGEEWWKKLDEHASPEVQEVLREHYGRKAG